MHRIDHATADPNANGTGKSGFTEGNPGLGTPATVVTDDWLNDLQENIMNVLAAAGIAPVKGDFDNLVDAITTIAAASAGLWVDGNAAGPGARFASDTDTGIFRPGANRMGFSTAGVQRAEFEANGRLKCISPAYAPEVALAIVAGSVAIDFAAGQNFSLEMTADAELAVPSNQQVGQNGIIAVKQDATGGRTLDYAAGWTFENGEVPTLPTTANSESLLAYHVSSNGLHARLLEAFS